MRGAARWIAPDLDTAVALFEAAIEAHTRAGDQFETARTRLH